LLRVYTRMLGNADWRSKISKEVGLAFEDNDFSWVQFFNEHDLYSADSESDAREYAEKLFVKPLRLIESS